MRCKTQDISGHKRQLSLIHQCFPYWHMMSPILFSLAIWSEVSWAWKINKIQQFFSFLLTLQDKIKHLFCILTSATQKTSRYIFMEKAKHLICVSHTAMHKPISCHVKLLTLPKHVCICVCVQLFLNDENCFKGAQQNWRAPLSPQLFLPYPKKSQFCQFILAASGGQALLHGRLLWSWRAWVEAVSVGYALL